MGRRMSLSICHSGLTASRGLGCGKLVGVDWTSGHAAVLRDETHLACMQRKVCAAIVVVLTVPFGLGETGAQGCGTLVTLWLCGSCTRALQQFGMAKLRPL